MKNLELFNASPVDVAMTNRSSREVGALRSHFGGTSLAFCKETGKQEMIEIEIERVKRRVYSVSIFNQRYTGIYRKQEVLKRNNKKLERRRV